MKQRLDALMAKAQGCSSPGQGGDVMKCYEQTILEAQNNGLLEEQAMACEAYGYFLLEWGNPRFSRVYLKDAYDLYGEVGELGRQKQLAKYLDSLPLVGADSSPVAHLNLDTLLKATQTLVSEMEIPRLVDKLLSIVVEDTAAQRAVLVLISPDSSELEVVAENPVEAPDKVIDPVELRLPMEIVRYSARSREYVVLNDIAAQPLFSNDIYLKRHKPKSLICAPLIAQTELIGLLYLESMEELEAFVPSQIETTKLVVTLAAVSLKNARLCQERILAEEARSDLERQLLVSQRMDAVGHLVGGVAHDFNNVLNAIFGFSDLCLFELDEGLVEVGEGSSLRENIELILDSAERAASLARQLLMFSSQRNSKLKLLSLNKVIDSLEKMLRRLIGERYQLDLQLDAGLNNVTSDISQMEQVLLNLVLNARDAMPEGGRITVSTRNIEAGDALFKQHPELSPQSMVLLQVSDTGHGMSPEVQSMIFEPFFTTKEAGKGTGLGLATTLGVVKENNGYIFCDSAVGQGAMFSVCLPSGTRGSANKEAGQHRTLPHGDERILFVDDDAMVRQVVVKLLSKLGYQVDAEECAEDALTRYAEGAAGYDLLITDVVMPGIDGVDLARQLLSAQWVKRVLYISGYPNGTGLSTQEKEHLLLHKPLNIKQLATAVRRALDE